MRKPVIYRKRLRVRDPNTVSPERPPKNREEWEADPYPVVSAEKPAPKALSAKSFSVKKGDVNAIKRKVVTGGTEQFRELTDDEASTLAVGRGFRGHTLEEASKASTVQQLLKLGWTEDQAVRLLAAKTLGLRMGIGREVTVLQSADDVAKWAARKGLYTAQHEEIWVLALNRNNAIAGMRLVGRGGLDSAQTTMAEILRAVLEFACSAFILVHNHPSGVPTPSPEDLSFTSKVKASAQIVGITILDHVIVARGGAFCSFMEIGKL